MSEDLYNVANRFLVGAQDGRIVILNTPAPCPLSRRDALNLAAWLVALASESPGHRDFLALLDAVERT